MSSGAIELGARVDALVVGGGVAGLWTLNALLANGYDAFLVESAALGTGQTVHAQGIVHGGGKYALRSVGDLASVRAIRDMPDRWRAHSSGERTQPDLRSARVLSEGCWLWLPKDSWKARVEAWGVLPMLRHAGMLACPPEPRPKSEWPAPLQKHALRALRMAEPVLDTRSVVAALAEPVADRILAISGEPEGIRIGEALGHGGRSVALRAADGTTLALEACAVIFTAGAGNEALLESVGLDGAARMQRRPLRTTVLRGTLGPLHGHCISGGRTRITVTSVPDENQVVWQVGGEVAEQHANAGDSSALHRAALAEIASCLPGLDLSGVEIGSYASVRAEARDLAHRRPSGAQVETVAPGLIVAWPTKLALAPLLAEDVLEVLAGSGTMASGPSPLHGAGRWPRPEVAAYPWKDVTWFSVASAARA
jgi:glycine/D-amino acid oxidase-like deaminating enzyme